MFVQNNWLLHSDHIMLSEKKTYTECRGWHCQWRPPRCRWWRRWASPCVFLCWAPKYSHSEQWRSRLSSGTLGWSLLPAPSSPIWATEIQQCRLLCSLNNQGTHALSKLERGVKGEGGFKGEKSLCPLKHPRTWWNRLVFRWQRRKWPPVFSDWMNAPPASVWTDSSELLAGLIK